MMTIRLVSGLSVLAVLMYTIAVLLSHGSDLLTPYFSDLFAVNWSGQFNLDFGTYLLLSTMWFVWRNSFSTVSLVCAPLVLFGGILVFGSYLLVMSFRVGGRLDLLLLGPSRVETAV